MQEKYIRFFLINSTVDVIFGRCKESLKSFVLFSIKNSFIQKKVKMKYNEYRNGKKTTI